MHVVWEPCLVQSELSALHQADICSSGPIIVTEDKSSHERPVSPSGFGRTFSSANKSKWDREMQIRAAVLHYFILDACLWGGFFLDFHLPRLRYRCGLCTKRLLENVGNP
jgi:hypothetical protein